MGDDDDGGGRAKSSDCVTKSMHPRFRDGKQRLYRVEMFCGEGMYEGDLSFGDSREFLWIGGKRIFTAWSLRGWLLELFSSLNTIGEPSMGESEIFEDDLILARQEWCFSEVMYDDASRVAGQAFTVESHLHGKEDICEKKYRMLFQQSKRED